MSGLLRAGVAVVVLAAVTPSAVAQGRAKAARELAAFLVVKFGARAGSVTKLATRIETLAVRHGDEAVLALRKGSPAAVELVEQAGANGGKALKALAAHGLQAEARILSRPTAMRQLVAHGDDAALALVKHPGVAEPLIEKGGASAVKALAGLEAQSGRRLAMLAEGEMAKHPEVFGVAAKHGERAVKFMWDNKVALGGTAAAAAFVANPEPFLDGSAKLVTATGDAVVKPVVQEAVGVVSTVLYALLAVVVVVAAVVVFLAAKHPAALRTAGQLAVAGVKAAGKR